MRTRFILKITLAIELSVELPNLFFINNYFSGNPPVFAVNPHENVINVQYNTIHHYIAQSKVGVRKLFLVKNAIYSHHLLRSK